MEKVELNKTTKTDVFQIDPRRIVVMDGFNSRSNFGDIDELAAQIKEQGMLNPISVQSFKDENGEERYKLIDGERRYRAVMKLINSGFEIARIKALVLPKTLSQADLFIQQAMRNEGKQFNEYEWGVLVMKLMNVCGFTRQEVADKLGKNVGMISYWLQIHEMDEEQKNLVRDGKLTGVDLRKIIRGNNGDQDGIKEDITKLQEKAQENGAKKLRLKDLDITSKTIIYKDSKMLLAGLNVLFKYIEEYQKADGMEIEINLMDISQKLKEGMLIDEIFERAKGTTTRKAE